MEELLQDLTTKEHDISFHASRISFCIVGDVIHFQPFRDTRSHLEWMLAEGILKVLPEEQKEGGIAEGARYLTRQLEGITRGFYLSELNQMHFYKGSEFDWNERVIEDIKDFTLKIVSMIHYTYGITVRDYTFIILGPKDLKFNGKEYHQLNIGEIGFLKNREFLKGVNYERRDFN